MKDFVTAAEERPDRNCFTLPDGSCIGRNCMHDVKPTAAAEWAKKCYRKYHPLGMCSACADAFARQQVEIERSRWISDQCTANQAGQAMGQIEGYTEGWNAALEEAERLAQDRVGNPLVSRTGVDLILDAVRDEEATLISASIAALRALK